jgi:hypothetical protein
MTEAIDLACFGDREGASVLSTLLLDKDAKAPLLNEVKRNDHITSAIWYIWWDQRHVTHLYYL